MAIKKQTEKEIINLLKNKNIKNILDVGCGAKTYKKLFDGIDYKGIDVKVSGRKEKEKSPDEYFDGVNIPEDDNKYSLILCTEVLEHCVEPEKLLMEIKRVAKSNGYILITVPFIWGLHEEPYDFRRYTYHGIKNLIEKTGLEVIKQEKTDKGSFSIAKLTASEILNETGSKGVRYWAGIVAIVACLTFISKILRIKMSRIYLGNQIIAQKK